MLTLFACAKINLTLEILGRRADGYHELMTVFQTIDLKDTLSFSEQPAINSTSKNILITNFILVFNLILLSPIPNSKVQSLSTSSVLHAF